VLFRSQPFAECSASRLLSRSFAHTLGFYAWLRDENSALQDRLQRLKALRRSLTSPLRKTKLVGVRSVVFSPPCHDESPTKAKSRLREAVRKANEDAAHLQAEVEQLRLRVKEMREAAAADKDDETTQQVAAKRKEIEELTEQLDAAMAENKRLKQLIDS
jgi:DNA repair exonuclease SbcCD ATPase subunit